MGSLSCNFDSSEAHAMRAEFYNPNIAVERFEKQAELQKSFHWEALQKYFIGRTTYFDHFY